MLAKIFEIEYRESAQSRMVADFGRFEDADSFESSEQSLVRSKFMPQMPLGAVPIAEIEFDVFCRHELVPILMALQHLYVNRPQVIDEICTLIEADITAQPSPKLGCTGLTYWEVLVLAALRLGANLDYDQLSDLATCHRKIRQMMGISDWDQKRYPKSTVHDNLSSLLAATIESHIPSDRRRRPPAASQGYREGARRQLRAEEEHPLPHRCQLAVGRYSQSHRTVCGHGGAGSVIGLAPACPSVRQGSAHETQDR